MKKRNRMIAGVICACMLLGNIEAPIVASAASSDEAYTLTSMQDDMDHEMEEDELEEVPGNVDETESAEDPEDWSGAENEGADQAEDIENVENESGEQDEEDASENEQTDSPLEAETPEEGNSPEEENDLEAENNPEGETELPEKMPQIMYQVHVQKKGWMDWVSDYEVAGTTGESLRVEAVRIKLVEEEGPEQTEDELPEEEDTLTENPETEVKEESHVEYRVHVRNIGWQDWKRDGELAGTTGEKLQIEAIQIRLTGDIASEYEVYYKSHSATFGWFGLVKGGDYSGTERMSKRIEAISIGLEKIENEQDISERGFVKGYSSSDMKYSGHVQGIGTTEAATSGETLGTVGSSKRLEALSITLDTSNGLEGVVEYQAHVQNIGWQPWKENGQLAGTTGESKRMEAVKIRIKGDASKYYDIYYRTHVQSLGWLGWAKNGQIAGTTESSLRIEALQIMLVVKENAAPGENSGYYVVYPRNKNISGVPLLKQYPDFPNGCEAISLNMVMRYLGYEIPNSEMCNIYLPRGPIHSTDPYEAYMGNPAGENAGYGCWATVIVKTADKYFKSKGISPKCAKNISDSTPTEIYKYVALGKPVIVWVTLDMGSTGEWFQAGTVNGKGVYWPRRAHCMVLTGYDLNRGTVKVNDPIRGTVEYSMSDFEKAYKNMGKNAVIIE